MSGTPEDVVALVDKELASWKRNLLDERSGTELMYDIVMADRAARLRTELEAAKGDAAGVDVNDLAQEIRRVDGSHSLGAGALAEALLPFIRSALTADKSEASQ